MHDVDESVQKSEEYHRDGTMNSLKSNTSRCVPKFYLEVQALSAFLIVPCFAADYFGELKTLERRFGLSTSTSENTGRLDIHNAYYKSYGGTYL